MLKRKGSAKDAEKGEQQLSVYNYAPDPDNPDNLAAWAAQQDDAALAALLAADAARGAAGGDRCVVDVEVRAWPLRLAGVTARRAAGRQRAASEPQLCCPHPRPMHPP